MADVIELKSKFELMPEGIHLVKVSKIKKEDDVDSKFGGKTTKREIYFENEDGVDVRKTYYGSSKQLIGDMTVLLGQGAKLDFESLVGRPAQVVIAHVTKGDKTYANIQAIAKAPGGAKSSIVAAAKAAPQITGIDSELGF